MANDVSPEPLNPFLEVLRPEPNGLTGEEIRARIQPQPSERSVRYQLWRLEDAGVVEHAPDPTDHRKTRYRIRTTARPPAGAGRTTPLAPAGSFPSAARDAAPPPDVSSADTAPSPNKPAPVSDSGALQARAFAELQARAAREVVRDVVLHLVPKSAVAGMARVQAAILHWNYAETETLIARVQDELPHVTETSAAAYDLTAAEVLAWRQVYDADATVAAPPPPESRDASGDRRDPAAAHQSGSSPAHAKNAPAAAPGSSPSHPAAAERTNGERDDGNVPPSLPTIDSSQSNSLSPLSAALAKSLGPTLADWLSRHTGGAFATKDRVVLGSTVMALLVLVFQALGKSQWAAVAVPVFGFLALVGLGASSRPAASGADAAGTTSGASQPLSVPPPARARRIRWIILGAGAALVALVVAIVWYQRASSRPPKAALTDYVAKALAPLPLRVAEIEPTYGTPGATGCPVTYQALLETTEPLYRRIDAAEYLRAHAAGELAVIAAADALLRGPNGARIRATVGASAPAGWPLTAAAPNAGAAPLVLVTTETPSGTVTTVDGTLVAWRSAGSWRFTGSPVTPDRRVLAGDPKPAGARAVDVPADAASLTALIADHVAFADKVQAAAAALAADLERGRQQQAAVFSELLRPGTLITGTIVDPIRGRNQRVIIELTRQADQQLSAVLRNDGGWTDARSFTGAWTIAESGDVAAVTLRTSRNDYIEGAGPLLQDRLDWSLALQVRADGSVSAMPGNTPLRRVDPAGAGAVKAEALGPVAAALAATAPGMVYRGTAQSRAHSTIEPLLLRFTAQDGLEIRATIESTTVAARTRAFRGAVVSASYRVGNAPIQLQSENNARVAGADPYTPFGFNSTNDSYTMPLHVEGPNLVGEDNWFLYHFGPAAAPGSGTRPGDAQTEPPTIPPYNLPPAGAGSPWNPAPEAEDTTPKMPPMPRSPGAYVLSAGHWMILPRNLGTVVALTALPIDGAVGELIFYGDDRVPAAPAGEVTLIYVGRLAPLSAATLKQFPRLKTNPRFELAPLVLGSGITRYVMVAELAADFTGFGARKVTLAVEQPADDVALLRCKLPAGRYGLACGSDYFELAVQ